MSPCYFYCMWKSWGSPFLDGLGCCKLGFQYVKRQFCMVIIGYGLINDESFLQQLSFNFLVWTEVFGAVSGVGVHGQSVDNISVVRVLATPPPANSNLFIRYQHTQHSHISIFTCSGHLNTNILFIKTWDRHPNCFVEGHASRCCDHRWQSDHHAAVATIDGSIFHLTNMNICCTTAHVSTCKLSISVSVCRDVGCISLIILKCIFWMFWQCVSGGLMAANS